MFGASGSPVALSVQRKIVLKQSGPTVKTSFFTVTVETTGQVCELVGFGQLLSALSRSSQTSPSPSPSLSSWPGLATSRQLSQTLPTPSPSRSAWSGLWASLARSIESGGQLSTRSGTPSLSRSATSSIPVSGFASRSSPSKSVAGAPAWVPASIAGEPPTRWKSPEPGSVKISVNACEPLQSAKTQPEAPVPSVVRLPPPAKLPSRSAPALPPLA